MEAKIKQRFKLNVLIPAIVSYIVFGITAVIWGFPSGIYMLGIIIIFYAFLVLYTYYRTKHLGSLISAVYLFVFGSFLFSVQPYIEIGKRFQLNQTSAILFAITIILLVWVLYLNFTKKLKWRGREILELAAQNIDEAKGSHTDRPLPTGSVEFSRKDLEFFANFFEKNLLGLAYREDSRIVFMPLKYKNEYFALFNPNYNYHEKTWVAISNTGQVSVNISKEDYLDYKEDLAFDQLCNSLNDILIEFIELYIDGRQVRIVDQMDDLKVSIFS